MENTTKLKRAEIKEGRVYLEGKVLENPQLITLKTLNNVFGKITNSQEELDKTLYEDIVRNAPEGADSYIKGDGFRIMLGMVLGGYDSILYLSSGINPDSKS